MLNPVILGSESPNADVLVYDKDVAYYTGLLQINVGGVDYDLEMDVDTPYPKVTYEFVNEV